jgi:nucleotide-binding universal stress UspA family protein
MSTMAASSDAPLVLLVATDDSPAAAAAIRAARDLILRLQGRVDVHIVCVYEPPHGADVVFDAIGATRAEVTGDALHAETQFDARMRAVARDLPVPVQGHFHVGKAAEAIVQLAAELGAGLVVIGSHGRTGFARAVLGSVAETVSRSAPCPVLIVRSPETPTEVAIEPPCTACVAARAESAGQRMWCERHAQHHPRARTHVSVRPTVDIGSQLIRTPAR